MKTLLLAAALLGSAPAFAQVTVTLGQPGFYGPIDMGNYGRPPVVYAKPIVIERDARSVAQPAYLRVPPGHQKKWAKHCAQYNACGQQVYFVKDDWYTRTYAPRYQKQHAAGHSKRADHHDRANGADHGKKGHGNGHVSGHETKGHGNGHGKGKN
jgi:hypothetical protein